MIRLGKFRNVIRDTRWLSASRLEPETWQCFDDIFNGDFLLLSASTLGPIGRSCL
jgi:hypothetical protein